MAMLVMTLLFAAGLEGIAWLVVGTAPLDPRYTCAANAPVDTYRIFSYGGSTVFGTPVPEYGFMSQLAARLNEQAPGRYTVCNMGEGGRDSSGVLLDVEKTLRYAPDLVVVLSGHNEFLQPAFQATGTRRMQEWVATLSSVRLAQKFMKRLNHRKHTESAEQPTPQAVQAVARDSADFQARVSRYHANLTQVVALTGDAGVPLLLGTLSANLKDWPPVYRSLAVANGGVSDPDRIMRSIDAAIRDDAKGAQALLDAGPLPSEEAKAPVMQFLRARIALATADDHERPALLATLQQANDNDPVPWRASSDFNVFVRGLAASAGHVTLLDVDSLLRHAASDGLPGFDLITDNCHPTPHANHLIASAILAQIAVQTNQTLDYPDDAFALFMAAQPAELQLDYQLRNGIYTMKVPFFNYPVSRRYFLQADALATNDWRIDANLGALSLLEGDKQQGIERLTRALSRQPDQRELLARRNSPYLLEALAQADLRLDDIPIQ
ncbi:MAG: SGNH/GDSL hydrolase family protein [Pseudomonadales bacterium]